MLNEYQWQDYYKWKGTADHSKWGRRYYLNLYRKMLKKEMISFDDFPFKGKIELKRWSIAHKFLMECFPKNDRRGNQANVFALSTKEFLLLIDYKPIFKAEFSELMELDDIVRDRFRRTKCFPIRILEKTTDEESGVVLYKLEVFSLESNGPAEKYLAYYEGFASISNTPRVLTGVKVKVRNQVIKKLKG